MSDEWDDNPLVIASRLKKPIPDLTFDRFLVRYEMVGCNVLLHEYTHVLRANVAAMKREKDGRVELSLDSVRKAPKRKGDALIGPFKPGRDTIHVINTQTFALEDLGNGIIHFSAPDRSAYGFIIPGKRVFVASSQTFSSLLRTPPQGKLSLVSNG